ncbi:MAG: hypothetical protein JWO08_1800, partial [Verrucomicrobiaceae bacterium]|nr:hypothetical protein [Verrucomicrobiaceae bacterium]
MDAFSDSVRTWRISLLIGLLIMGVQPQLAAGVSLEPLLEISTKGTCEKDFIKEEYNWFRDRLLLPQSKTWGSKMWAADARKFGEAALLATATEVTKGRTITDMSAAADTLMAAGCDDPLICYLAYKAHENWRAGSTALERAAGLLADTGMKGAIAALIAGAELQIESTWSYASPKYAALMVAGLKRSLTDGSYAPGDLNTLMRHHLRCLADMKGEDKALILELKDIYAKSSLPEWARLTLEGEADVLAAWRDRGSSTADKVTVPGWKGFAEYLGLAHEALEKAWNLNPGSPHAAARMITVGMGESAPHAELFKWFDRATTAEFDCPMAYSALRSALMPRWGGSYEEMIGLGLASARTQRFNSDVPAVLWTVCEFVARETSNPKQLYAIKEVRDAL